MRSRVFRSQCSEVLQGIRGTSSPSRSPTWAFVRKIRTHSWLCCSTLLQSIDHCSCTALMKLRCDQKQRVPWCRCYRPTVIHKTPATFASKGMLSCLWAVDSVQFALRLLCWHAGTTGRQLVCSCAVCANSSAVRGRSDVSDGKLQPADPCD